MKVLARSARAWPIRRWPISWRATAPSRWCRRASTSGAAVVDSETLRWGKVIEKAGLAGSE